TNQSSVGPSRKRCKYPTATVTLPIHDSRALFPTHAHILPHRKRFRDSISPKDSVEEDIDVDVLADIEADIAATETTACMDVKAGIDVGIGIEANVGVDREYEADEDFPDMVSADETREVMQMGFDAALQVLYDHMQEIPMGGIADIEVGQRQLEADSMIASGERVGLLDRVVSLETSLCSEAPCNSYLLRSRLSIAAVYPK
nr:hypothetical protein [Tanacetum cinerariifolium]